MRPQRGWIGESHLRMLSGNAPVSNEQNARDFGASMRHRRPAVTGC